MSTTVCLYFPGNPTALFQFLESVLGYETWRERTGQAPDKVEVLLWVDNDDHKTSSEFYTLRKMVRKGLNLQMFINPKLDSSQAVFDELQSKASGDEVLINNAYENHLGLLLGGPTVFDEEEAVREVKRHA